MDGSLFERLLSYALYGGMLLATVGVGAGETILSENFENLDLAKLPQGWRATAGDEVSIVQEPGGSKVLRIAHKGKGTAELQIPLNVDQVRGRTVTAKVRAKCPAGYQFVQEKQGAPQLMVVYRAKDGNGQGRYSMPPPQQRSWVEPTCPVKIPEDAAGAFVSLRVNWIECEAFFDDLTISVDGAPSGVTATGGGNAPAGAGAPSGPAQKSIARKSVEEHGARMGPEVIASMGTLRRPGATAKTFTVLGPGAPLKDVEDPKLLAQWTRLAAPKELTGAAATVDNLFLHLPAFLSSKKPEVVILACGNAKGRKTPYKERYDWEDLARLCLRFGALPVLAVPENNDQCPSRMEILEAVKNANLPAVGMTANAEVSKNMIDELGVPAVFSQRVVWILDQLERHICGRASAVTDAGKPAGKGADDE